MPIPVDARYFPSGGPEEDAMVMIRSRSKKFVRSYGPDSVTVTFCTAAMTKSPITCHGNFSLNYSALKSNFYYQLD